jgi:hypothetical protein
MKTRDLISWLLALLIVGSIVGGALYIHRVLCPDAAPQSSE